MRKTKILSLFIFICALIYTASCFSFTKEIDHKLETTVQKIIQENHLPGAVVGIWIPGKGEWIHASGLADKKTKEKITINDHFRVRGIPSALVMIGIYQLIDKGKISLDDKISQYVENVPNGDKITLKNLMDHTSGLPYPTPYKEGERHPKVSEGLKASKIYPTKMLVENGLTYPVLSNPGEKWNPNAMDSELLSLVIEKVTGNTLKQYFEKNVLEPLALKNTSFPHDYANMQKPFAHGYIMEKFNNAETAVDRSFFNPVSFLVDGVSNLHDLRVLIEAIGTGKLLSKKSLKEQFERIKDPETHKETNQGHGIRFDNGWVKATGGSLAYSSEVAYLPEKEATIVCLTNTGDMLVEKNGGRMVPALFLCREIEGILNLPLMEEGVRPVQDNESSTKK